MRSRLFQGNQSNHPEKHLEQLQAKQKILVCQINQYARMAECKRLADAQGKEAMFQENKYVKAKIELTESVEHYLALQEKSLQALAELTSEIALHAAGGVKL